MFEANLSQGASRWQVIRMVAGSETRVVLLTASPFALTVHFVGHSVPCAGDGCALCEFLPGRGLFYFAAICGQRASILELSAMSWCHMEQHAKLLHGGVRVGQVYHLTRRGAKNPVYAECVDFRDSTKEVPLIELVQRVMAVYKFAPPNPLESLEKYEIRMQQAALLRNSRLADQYKHKHLRSVDGR